jgi:hypothetical protein
MEKRVPDCISSNINFFFNRGAMDPKVMIPMPNNKIPRQAAMKTRFLLYIFKFKEH